MTPTPEESSEYLIIGAGILGLAMARTIREAKPHASIHVIEKESVPAWHASGRNSGVLHAGFYYSSDSLKARFTREGNRFWREYCLDRGLPMNPSGKVVVARTEVEAEGIKELKRRGDVNGVDVSIIDEKELAEIEPNAKTAGIALWSPTTMTVDPNDVAKTLEKELTRSGVRFFYETPYQRRIENGSVRAGNRVFRYHALINAAGLHADRIAQDFGFASDLLLLPFKGIYLESEDRNHATLPVGTNIYPVPDLRQLFLGVHFTVKVDGTVKIGPTAIPAFWRENYKGLDRFEWTDFREIVGWESSLFFKNDFGFRDLALEEIRKYSKKYMVEQSRSLVKTLDPSRFTKWGNPGIRAQLLDTRKRVLISDFRVEGDRHSIHILNAVSPAFTASIPFARWIFDEYGKNGQWISPEKGSMHS